MNSTNSNSSDNVTLLYRELTQIYENQAKEFFSYEKTEEDFSIVRNNYEKYYKQCVENLEAMDPAKVEEECQRLEEEINTKISDVEEAEKKLKSLALEGGVNKSIMSLEEEEESVSHLVKNLRVLKNKAKLAIKRAEEVEGKSLESTKKMKKDYENQNEYLVRALRDNLFKNVRESTQLQVTINEKHQALKKKEVVHQSNLSKVELKENDLNVLQEKLTKVSSQNQMAVEEIRTYDLKLFQTQEHIKSLDARIKTKKSPLNSNKAKKNIHLLQLDSKEDSSILKIFAENINCHKDIELNQMALEDYLTLIHKKNENETLINEKKGNILSLTGIMMNCLLSKKKIDRAKKNSDQSTLFSKEVENTHLNFDVEKKHEAAVYEAAEKLKKYKDVNFKHMALLIKRQKTSTKLKEKNNFNLFN